MRKSPRSTDLITPAGARPAGGATAGAGLALADPVGAPPGDDTIASGGAPPHGPRHRGTFRSAALRSVLLYAFTLWVIATLIFCLPRLMPGDPLQALEDPDNALFLTDPVVRAEIEAYYGLDKPVLSQYVSYLGGLAQGDFGFSIARKTAVADLIKARLPWTLLLMGVSLTVASFLSFIAGVTATWRRGRFTDRTLLTALTVAKSVPEYAIAAVLLITFAVAFPVLPLFGARTPFADYGFFGDLADVGKHLVLPASALTISLVGTKFLLVRNTMISTLGQDYMVLARAKGLPNRLLKYRHAGRNALLPFLTIVGIQAGFAVGGSVFVESVFAYPGMGSLILSSVEFRDYPVLEATFLVLAVVVLGVNLALELVYARVDPRVGAE